MYEFSFTRASALDLLEHLEKTVVPPEVNPSTLCTESQRLALMHELGKRELVEDLLMLSKREGET